MNVKRILLISLIAVIALSCISAASAGFWTDFSEVPET